MKNQSEALIVNVSPEKTLFLAELSQAVSELNQALKGQLSVPEANQLLDELSYPEPDSAQSCKKPHNETNRDGIPSNLTIS
jgi:hypothetical protein